MKKRLSLILALLMLCAVAMAEEADVPAPYGYNELRVATLTPMEGDFFNGRWATGSSDLDVRNLIHGYPLMLWNADSGSWEVNSRVVNGSVCTQDEAGNHRYVFSLNRDLAYSDGTPITAGDYAFSMLLGIAPEMTEIGAGVEPYAMAILGAEEYAAGEADAVAGIELLDEYRLAVTIRHEVLPFFYELGMLNYTPYPMAVIAPGCALESAEGGVRIGNRELFTAELLRKTVLDPETGYLSHPSVVSGPYRLVSFDPETQTAVFESNSGYQANREVTMPRIPRITFRAMTEAEAVNGLVTGEIDLLNKAVEANLINAGLAEAGDSGNLVARNYLRSGMSFVGFNCERPAMAESVRKAIAQAVDKDGFIAEYVGDYGTRVDGYYGLGQWMYGMLDGESGKQAADALAVYTRDMDAAAKRLEDDGWNLNEKGKPYAAGTDGARCKNIGGKIVPLKLKMLTSAESETAALFEKYMAEPLKEIGIALTVEAVPFADMMAAYTDGGERDFDMLFLGTNFDEVFDPALSFACGEDMTGMNRTRIQDQELYTKALALRRTEPGDAEGYRDRWVEFQARWTEVLPCLPLYSNVYYDFHSGKLRNYDISANTSWAKAIEEAYLSDAVSGGEKNGF